MLAWPPALLVNGDLGGVGDLAVDDDLERTRLGPPKTSR
jgi:hypothetical protein